MSSEVPHTVQSRARKLAKEKGVRYTAALTEVQSGHAVNPIVARVREALQVLDNHMTENICYSEETQATARRAIASLVRKSGSLAIIAMHGVPDTGQKDLATAITHAVFGDDAKFLLLNVLDPTDNGMRRLKSAAPWFEEQMLDWSVDELREYAAPRNAGISAVFLWTRPDEYQRRLPVDASVDTHLPPLEAMMNFSKALLEQEGITLDAVAEEKMSYRLQTCIDTNNFWTESWRNYITDISSKIISNCLIRAALSGEDTVSEATVDDLPDWGS